MVTLFCCIFGEEDCFAIEISPDQTVSVLQKAIIAQNSVRFQGIDTRKVVLWQAEIPDNGKAISSFNLAGATKLRLSFQINKYFIRDPPQGHIHVVTRVSFSNYAYFLTVLSSLKPLPPVSETRVSFLNTNIG